MITVYSTGCPRCTVLEKKLLQADIMYKICEDRDVMKDKGIDSLPVLEVNGQLLGFAEAIKWVNERS